MIPSSAANLQNNEWKRKEWKSSTRTRDLNPTEILWWDLQRAANKRMPTNVNQLKQHCKKKRGQKSIQDDVKYWWSHVVELKLLNQTVYLIFHCEFFFCKALETRKGAHNGIINTINTIVSEYSASETPLMQKAFKCYQQRSGCLTWMNVLCDCRRIRYYIIWILSLMH